MNIKAVTGRYVALLTTLWLCALPALAQPAAPFSMPERDVHVKRAGERFTVDTVIHAPVPPARAWEVLTDFEHMARFIPNLTESEVIERQGKLLKVRQKGVARYGPFSSAFESVREVTLTPPREIRAHNVGGNIKQMDSLMTLEPEESGTRLTYHAEVQPGFWFPPLLGPSLVQHETAEQFSAMVREMQKRHTP